MGYFLKTKYRKYVINCDVDIENKDFKEKYTQEFKSKLDTDTRCLNSYYDDKDHLFNMLKDEKEFEDYRGLDNLMYRINPEGFTKEQRAKFMRLCDICPNMQG